MSTIKALLVCTRLSEPFSIVRSRLVQSDEFSVEISVDTGLTAPTSVNCLVWYQFFCFNTRNFTVILFPE